MMLERVRSAIGAELASLGVQDQADFRETMLIRNGLFCGRKFQCQGFQVVWFMEENEIKFFSPDGTMLLATTLERCLEPQHVQTRLHPFVPDEAADDRDDANIDEAAAARQATAEPAQPAAQPSIRRAA